MSADTQETGFYTPSLMEASKGWKHLVKLPKRGCKDGDLAYRKKKRGRVFHHLITWDDARGDFNGFDFTCKAKPPKEMEGLEEGGEWLLLEKGQQCKTCSSILEMVKDYDSVRDATEESVDNAHSGAPENYKCECGTTNQEYFHTDKNRGEVFCNQCGFVIRSNMIDSSAPTRRLSSSDPDKEYGKGNSGFRFSTKAVRNVTYSKKWDGLKHKFAVNLDREQYENLKNEPGSKTKKGAKSGRWRVIPRTWVRGGRGYRYWARRIGERPNFVEYFPYIEEYYLLNSRRGAKASGMSFKIKKEIFRLIQEGNSKHIDRLMERYDYSLFDLFPKRGVNAPESKLMIERLKNRENIDDDELLDFSKKIWKTALSHLIGLQLQDRFGDEDRGVKESNHDWPKKKKQIQLYGPDFSVVVRELLFKSNEKMEVPLEGKIKAAKFTMHFINELREKRGVPPYESVTEYLLEGDPKLLEEYRSVG